LNAAPVLAEPANEAVKPSLTCGEARESTKPRETPAEKLLGSSGDSRGGVQSFLEKYLTDFRRQCI
jgi:hypothetical protein